MKSLSQDICMLIRASNMKQLQKTILDLIACGMAINLHMFGVFMKDWIGSNVNCRLVVTEELHRGMNCDLRVLKKLIQPQELISS